MPAQPERQPSGVEGHAGPAGGGGNAPPVGVAAVHGALHQRRAADGAGDGAGAGVIGRTLHPHLEQAGGALTVAGDRLGQVLRHRRQAGLQGIKELGAQGLTGCKGQERVVGAGVAVHRDRIEGAIHRPAHHGAPHLGRHAGITAEVTQHRGHIGVNHPRALGHAADAHGAAAQISLQGDLLVH